MADFPGLSVKVGTFPCMWELPDGRSTGNITLDHARAPRGQAFEWPEIFDEQGAWVPREEAMPVCWGRLADERDVAFVNATASVWFPRRAILSGKCALVGLDLRRSHDLRFHSLEFQISGFTELFGIAPIKSTEFPMAATHEKRFALNWNPESELRWEQGDIEASCQFYSNNKVMDGYHFEISTAPMVVVEGIPETVDYWIDNWVTPLRNIATFATMHRQSVTWMKLSHALVSGSREVRDQRSAEIFGSGIAQQPFRASTPRYEPGSLPLFVFSRLPANLHQLLGTWIKLQQSHRRFFKPFMATLYQDLSPRSLFLYLVQALEGLHLTEHGLGAESQELHRQRRKHILAETKRLGLPRRDLAWLRRWVDNRGAYPLHERLAGLVTTLPSNLASALGDRATWHRIARIRNDLSHGAEDYSNEELRPFIAMMSIICNGHVLRLLGLSFDPLIRNIEESG